MKIHSHVYHGVHPWQVKTLDDGLPSTGDPLRRNSAAVQLPGFQEDAVKQAQKHASPFSLVKAGGFDEDETLGDLVDLV